MKHEEPSIGRQAAWCVRRSNCFRRTVKHLQNGAQSMLAIHISTYVMYRQLQEGQ